jgi:hypothetical protein
MRQGNSNKRMRGRGGGGGNTGRKGPNPLSRTYESTGPDVKIRGTALHIAEKYVSLARDAQSSGDPVLAESYLQHAEHYYRIIAAAQAAMPQPMPVVRSDIQSDDEEDDGEESYADTRFDSRGRGGEVNGNAEVRSEAPREPREPREPRGEGRPPFRRPIEVEGGDGYMQPDAPQPFVDDSALERVVADRGDDRRQGRSRFPRGRGDFRGEGRNENRGEGGRPPRERHARGEGRFEREPREARAEASPREEADESRLDALPAFLTAAPPRAAVAAVAAAAAAPAETPEAEEGETPRRRTRGGRGRGRRPEFAEAEGATEAAAPASAED